MKILVTGGLGFIGSHFVRHILKSQPVAEVVNFDGGTYAARIENGKDFLFNERHSLQVGYTYDQERVADLLAANEFDYIVNFAAHSCVNRSIENPLVFVDKNIRGSVVLMEEARKRQPGLKKFVHISTDEVYGSCEEGEYFESQPLNPLNPYSCSKAGQELYAKLFYELYGLPVVITNTVNNYGSRQFPEKLIPLVVKRVAEGKAIQCFGFGNYVRDWLHVKDNCAAIEVAMLRGNPGEKYHISAGEHRTNLEVIQEILGILNQPDYPVEMVGFKRGHDRRYDLNCEKIKALGWSKQRNFDEELRKEVLWFAEKFGVRANEAAAL